VLPKAQRVRTNRQHHTVLRRGRQLRGHGLSVRLVPNSLTHHRFGFVVSTKTAKRAVVRNRLKRQLRSAVQALHFSSPTGYDVVITGQTAALTLTYQQIVSELARLFNVPTRIKEK